MTVGQGNESARAILTTGKCVENRDERDEQEKSTTDRREQQARDYWSTSYGRDAEIASRGVPRL